MEIKKLFRKNKQREENEELKRTLAVCLNQPLIKDLRDSVKRIEKGEYISEKKFFKKQLKTKQ